MIKRSSRNVYDRVIARLKGAGIVAKGSTPVITDGAWTNVGYPANFMDHGVAVTLRCRNTLCTIDIEARNMIMWKCYFDAEHMNLPTSKYIKENAKMNLLRMLYGKEHTSV
jgi:hypothetical protein